MMPQVENRFRIQAKKLVRILFQNFNKGYDILSIF